MILKQKAPPIIGALFLLIFNDNVIDNIVKVHQRVAGISVEQFFHLNTFPLIEIVKDQFIGFPVIAN